MMPDYYLKDFVDRNALEALQLQRMQETLQRLYENVAFYRQAFDQAGLKPSDLRCLADLSKFPFTRKADLRDHYPYGMLAVPMHDIVRVHASSGTTGKPTVVCYTKRDLEIWAESVSRVFSMGGVSSKDIVMISYGYGLFTGGLGAHYGAEALGCSVIPMGGGSTEKQLMLIKDFGVNVLCCTPSFFIHIMEEAEKKGFDIRQTNLRVGFFGAEPWTEEMRQRIQTQSGITARDIFGLSEIIGPGVSADCPCCAGLHIFEDHYYPEIIDPDSGEVKEPGQEGELVFTTISKVGMPLLRYRTGDISSLCYDKCECGRTLVRMEKVRRRSDDMLIIRGVNLYPSQIESVLLSVKGTEPHYQLLVRRDRAMDELEVQVEVTAAVFSDEVKALESLRNEIQNKIKQIIGLSAKVTLVEPGQIERSTGKAKRVLDLRK
ncbi:MAG: phenylacetate--CoA ligase [Oligosphaeraceae bacterium]|nr:phenylacetate--CoA ligase [Oligosphaeraceae bacterium]